MISDSRHVSTSLSWFPRQFWRELCFPNHLSLAETGTVIGVLHASAMCHHTAPGTSNKYFPLPSASTCCWATDVAHYPTISGKVTNVCKSTAWRNASFPCLPSCLLVFKYRKVLFPLSRVVWQTNLINPKLCYFILRVSAPLRRITIRTWLWFQ